MQKCLYYDNRMVYVYDLKSEKAKFLDPETQANMIEEGIREGKNSQNVVTVKEGKKFDLAYHDFIDKETDITNNPLTKYKWRFIGTLENSTKK